MRRVGVGVGVGGGSGTKGHLMVHVIPSLSCHS